MKEIKITRKLLDEYRDMRKKRTIPILEMELEEMKQGDSGLIIVLCLTTERDIQSLKVL